MEENLEIKQNFSGVEGSRVYLSGNEILSEEDFRNLYKAKEVKTNNKDQQFLIDEWFKLFKKEEDDKKQKEKEEKENKQGIIKQLEKVGFTNEQSEILVKLFK